VGYDPQYSDIKGDEESTLSNNCELSKEEVKKIVCEWMHLYLLAKPRVARDDVLP
jgi:hypothetical protein